MKKAVKRARRTQSAVVAPDPVAQAMDEFGITRGGANPSEIAGRLRFAFGQLRDLQGVASELRKRHIKVNGSAVAISLDGVGLQREEPASGSEWHADLLVKDERIAHLERLLGYAEDHHIADIGPTLDEIRAGVLSHQWVFIFLEFVTAPRRRAAGA